MEETLETKVAVLVERVNNMIDKLEDGDERMDDLDKRVKSLEESKWQARGALVLLGAISGWVGDLLLHALTK